MKREGTDVTIVTYSQMVHRSLDAAEELSKQDISVEVVALRALVSLDMDTIVQSVRKTRSLLIVHEAMKRAGAAGEIAMRHMQQHSLDRGVSIQSITTSEKRQYEVIVLGAGVSGVSGISYCAKIRPTV